MYHSLVRAPAQPTPSSRIGNQLKYHYPLHLLFNLHTTLHNHRNVSLPREQLDSPLGYFSAQPGQTLKDGTWTITRKLGWGPRSSTWLVIDKNDQHRALKILTAAATTDPNATSERHFVLKAMKAIQNKVPQLLDTFKEKDERGRNHFCLLFRLLGPSVEDLRQGNAYDGQNLPVHIVQKVIGDISNRLANLATQDIIHGGKSNYLFHEHSS